MKTEKTEMIMRNFDVTYKVAKQYEIILKDKQLRQIKAWYETKKGDGTISAESEEVLKEILNKGKIMKKVLGKKSWWQPNQESIFCWVYWVNELVTIRPNGWKLDYQ